MRIHLPKLLGFLETTICAAIWRILAFEIEVAASKTWCFAVAFDLTSFTFVADRGRLAAVEVGECMGCEDKAVNNEVEMTIALESDNTENLADRLHESITYMRIHLRASYTTEGLANPAKLTKQ
jgi:hypothetical protein